MSRKRPRMARILTSATLAAFVSSTVGCSSTRKIPLQTELDSAETPIHSTPGLKVAGWTDQAGRFHESLGFMRIASPDSLYFVANKDIRADVSQNWSDSLVYSVPNERIASLSAVQFSSTRTALLVLGVSALAGLVVFAASEPTLFPTSIEFTKVADLEDSR